MASYDDAERLLLTCVTCEQLLQEPVQLSCLHHCCRPCVDSVNASRASSDDNRASALSCKACSKVTPVCELTEDPFIATRLLQQGLSAGPVRCQFLCGGDDNEDSYDAAAEHWCVDCNKPLCSSCLRKHGKLNSTEVHTVVASSTVTAAQGSAGASSSVAKCSLHKKEFDFYCVQCADLKCGTCGKVCLSAGHRMQDSIERAGQAVEAVREARDALSVLATTVAKQAALLDAVEEARKRDTDRLRSNKRAVLDAVTDAFERSDRELQELYSELDRSAVGLADSAQRVYSGLRQAVTYSDALLSTKDAVAVLRQEARLLGCLRSLTDKANVVGRHVDVGASIAIDVQKPADFDAVLQRAIGLPQTTMQDHDGSSRSPLNADSLADRKTEDRSSRLPDGGATATHVIGGQAPSGLQPSPAVKPTAGGVSVQASDTDGRHGAAPGSGSNGGFISIATAAGSVPQLASPAASGLKVPASGGGGSSTNRASSALSPTVAASPASSFKAGARCYDIAVTSDGRVLIADGSLKEYNLSGKLVSEWTPPPVKPPPGSCSLQQDKVYAIGLSRDGILVAGMLISCHLQLLLRRREAAAGGAGGPTWQAEGRDFVIPSHPVRLSVCGDLCAVSCSDVASVTAASRCVYLVSLVDSTNLLNLDPQYAISNMLLTSRMVVVSSKSKQPMRDGSRSWVVDAYSHTAERLWRHELYDEASGICMSPLDGSAICVAQRNRADVIETVSSDGHSVKPILRGKTGMGEPWLVGSACSNSSQQQPLLVVVSGADDHVVTIYSSSDFT